MSRSGLAVAVCIAIVLLAMAVSCKPYTMHIGSKSDPEAHLFSYDQKWRESTLLKNYNLSMTASKEFVDCSRLSTRMDLIALPNLTEIGIDAKFSGIGRVGYVVLDPETGQTKAEMSRINHVFIGNFSMTEHIRVGVGNDSFGSFMLPPV